MGPPSTCAPSSSRPSSARSSSVNSLDPPSPSSPWANRPSGNSMAERRPSSAKARRRATRSSPRVCTATPQSRHRRARSDRRAHSSCRSRRSPAHHITRGGSLGRHRLEFGHARSRRHGRRSRETAVRRGDCLAAAAWCASIGALRDTPSVPGWSFHEPALRRPHTPARHRRRSSSCRHAHTVRRVAPASGLVHQRACHRRRSGHAHPRLQQPLLRRERARAARLTVQRRGPRDCGRTPLRRRRHARPFRAAGRGVHRRSERLHHRRGPHTSARDGVLDLVIRPYDSLFGQVKEAKDIRGLTAMAHARFTAWLRDSSHVPPAARDAVLGVHARWLDIIATLHDELRSQWGRHASRLAAASARARASKE